LHLESLNKEVSNAIIDVVAEQLAPGSSRLALRRGSKRSHHALMRQLALTFSGI